jgi:hypothetical protein
MEDWFSVINSIIPILAAIIGVVIGFGLSWGKEWSNQKNSKNKYLAVIYHELNELQNELKVRISDYNNLDLKSHDEYGVRKQNVSLQLDPEKFLLRWCYRPKYVFLHNNFEKISLFNEESIKSLIKIYSSLEEFEEWRQNAIFHSEKFNGIGTSPESIAKDCLIKAYEEIPKALFHLNNEKINHLNLKCNFSYL